MIIDKVAPYWTEEDRARLAEIKAKKGSLLHAVRKEREEKSDVISISFIEDWGNLEEAENQLLWEIENRYIRSHSKKAILKDVEEIVSAIEREEFQAEIADNVAHLASLQTEGADEVSLSMLREFAIENYENCYRYILHFLRVQLNAFANDEAYAEKARAIVDKRVSLWYVKETPSFWLMARGRATDALSFMSSKNAKIDRITGNATIEKFEVQLVILKLKELHASLGMSTDKLLSTAIASFTKKNDFRHKKTIDRAVTIPLKEYARLVGYDVDEHTTNTPEEAKKEKKRAKNQLDNARKAIKKDLDIIQASTLSWKEPTRGNKEPRDFARVSLVTFTGIINGEIKISFSPEIASYLAEKNSITQYPTKLLSLDNRKPTAYYLGRKLIEHYYMDSNQIRGTNDRLKISTLLEVTNLPSYEEVQKTDRGHWEERIKIPFEDALNDLKAIGVLKDYKYTHEKGVDLTEEEGYNITTYTMFSNLYLHFVPADKIDNTERLAHKIEARNKAIAEKKKRKTSKKKATEEKGGK